jgi:hypothetical protein
VKQVQADKANKNIFMVKEKINNINRIAAS